MPSSLHPNIRKFRRSQATRSFDYYFDGIQSGNRTILGQAITLIESELPRHQLLAQQLVAACLAHNGFAQRIGISGAPGVGKSTFIETIGSHAIQQGRKIAVLAVDPSSQKSGGSILGDKTRMQALSKHPSAFVRPSPAGKSLGGVARKTRETITICEAAGFDTILIETVGVGQSEIAVHSMVDCFLLLLLPGAGDELQGIKRGIVEMADLVAINKAEDNRLELAKATKRAYRNAIHLFPAKTSGWTPIIQTCSALKNNHIDTVWQHLQTYFRHVTDNTYLLQNRQTQIAYWFEEALNDRLQQWFRQQEAIRSTLPQLRQQALMGKKSPFQAVDELFGLLE